MRSFVFCVLSITLVQSAALLPLTFAEEEATQYTLRYKYTPSEFVHYAVESQNKIVVEKNEAKQTSTNTAKTQKHYRVVGVDQEGNGTLEMTIDRVQMSAQFDDEAAATFDSKDPKQKDLKQYEKIRETIGKPSRMVCSPLGKVISKADQSNQGFLIPLPENQVKVGDNWKEDYDIEVAVGKTLRKKVPIRRIFTLESVEDQIAVIEFKTNILTRLNDPKLGLQLIQKTPSGTIKLDIEKGIIVSQDVSLDKAQVGIFDGQGAMRAISSRVETLVNPSELAQKKQDSDSQ
tara:strand:- start:18446 stop:19315 length:870 start_codon:yes stop_codon:yes gene_type:complete